MTYLQGEFAHFWPFDLNILPFVLSEMFRLPNGRNSLESARYIHITPPELEIICLPKFWQREIKQLWQREPPAQASHLVRRKNLLKMFIQHLLSRKTSQIYESINFEPESHNARHGNSIFACPFRNKCRQVYNIISQHQGQKEYKRNLN